MNEKTSASKTKRWRVPTAKLTRGDNVLLETDPRLWTKASRGFSPSDARFSEQLRWMGETLKPDTSAETVAAFTALKLSFDLQVIAARLIDEPDSPDAEEARRQIAAIWRSRASWTSRAKNLETFVPSFCASSRRQERASSIPPRR